MSGILNPGVGRGVRAIATTRVSGEPRARGRAYGELLAAQVRAHIAAWLLSLERAGLGDPRGYIGDMLRETDFTTAIRQYAPDLLEEVAGIAQGAEVEPDLVYALQLMDEEWFHRGRRGSAARLEKCSSVAIVADGGPTWIGQNMDLGAYTDGYQALLGVEAHGDTPGVLVFTTAGMIGLMGVNDAGVGVCVNSLPQLPAAPEGVPVAFVIRRLLQTRSVSEAAALVQRMPHATNQHYVIAEPGAVRSFEASATGVVEYRAPDPSRVLHTNHPLGERQGEPEAPEERTNSVARLTSLVNRLGDGCPGIEDIQAALSSRDDPQNPVCRIPDGEAGRIGFTTGSMISALDHREIDSWVSPGPPSERGYTRFRTPVASPA